MATDTQTSEKFLAYDGDCPMCLSTIALVTRLKLVAPEQTRSNHILSGDELEAVRAAGIRNQLVVLDPRTGETRAGSDGLLWIIGENTGRHFLVRMLGWPGMRQLLRAGYEMISYNRRVISPPRHRIVCDCEPDVTLARRLSLIVPLLLWVILITGLFGASLFRSLDLGSGLSGALFVETTAAAGWAILIVAALVLLRGEQRVDYAAHLVVTMFAGVLLLLPAVVIAPVLPRPAAEALCALSALASFGLMFLMQRRRVAALGLTGRWLWGWVAALAIGSSTCAYLLAGSMMS